MLSSTRVSWNALKTHQCRHTMTIEIVETLTTLETDADKTVVTNVQWTK